MFKLSQRSLRNLDGVDSRLVAVVKRAITLTDVDFAVIEGLRTIERQRKLVESGASHTMNSKHLTGHAVDLAAYVDGRIRWDWPLYYKINEAMQEAAEQIGVGITWGGSWKTFKDGPHFQLNQ